VLSAGVAAKKINDKKPRAIASSNFTRLFVMAGPLSRPSRCLPRPRRGWLKDRRRVTADCNNKSHIRFATVGQGNTGDPDHDVWSVRLGSPARPGSDQTYFVNICLTGFATAGSAGEIANVSHVLQPGAWLAASKSP
jgi:hypothetical protein